MSSLTDHLFLRLPAIAQVRTLILADDFELSIKMESLILGLHLSDDVDHFTAFNRCTSIQFPASMHLTKFPTSPKPYAPSFLDSMPYKKRKDIILCNLSFAVVSWLHKFRPDDGIWIQHDLGVAIVQGKPNFIRLLLNVRPETEVSERHLVNAADLAPLEVVNLLLDLHPEKWTEQATYYAAKNGRLEIFQLLHGRGVTKFDANAIDTAAGEGKLEVVKFLHENCKGGCTTEAMDQACARGHLEVLRYLHDNRKEGCTKTAMDRAAANGHLDVVKFLHNERNEGCSKRAMNRAAAGGHIDVVKFLHEFREEGCTPDAIDHASRESLEVVQFLFKNRHEGCTAVAILEAVDGGKLDVVKYLYENHQDSFPLETMNSAFTSACLGGHLDIVKYLHGLDIILNVGPAALDMAARNGHLHVVKFLHTNRADGATTQALYMAIQMASSMNNSLNDTIKMDRINREQGMNISIGNLPAGNFIEGRREKFVNAFGVVQFLLENRNEGFTQECLEQVRACKEPLRTEALALFEQHMSKLRPGF